MKKLSLMLVCLGLMTTIAVANPADAYSIDDYAIEMLFNSSTEVALTGENASLFAGASFSGIQNEKDVVIAFILAWVVGSLGVHRMYLGTSTMVFVGYILTLGGCGIATIGDWIVLLIELVGDKNIDRFIDNPKFFMWM